MLPAVDELLDRFEESARGEVFGIAEAAVIAARETFGPFNDEEYSPFYAAEDLSPSATWEALAERVVDATTRVITLALAAERLSAALISDIHGHIFGSLFPNAGGRIRGRYEPGSYGIVIGRPGNPHYQRQTGTGGRSLPAKLHAICQEFNQAVDDAYSKQEPLFREDLVLPAIKAYAKLLSAHPFIDGNGRTCYLVLQFALVRMGLLTVALGNFEEHQFALGTALRTDGKQSYVQLRDLVADKIETARYTWDDD